MFNQVEILKVISDEQYKKLEVLKPDIKKSEQDLVNIMIGLRKLIRVCGDDPTRDGLEETPFRVLKAYLEYTEGYREDPRKYLEKEFDVDGHQELVIVKDIEFNSLCEHHFAPFHGRVHIGYIPNKKITGLSKFGRLVDGYSKRFQVQERLTTQIADAIDEVLQAQGVMVVVEAKHMCMCGRGIKKATSSTTTSAIRGSFKDNAQLRNEFLSLIK
ncbi:TPA: GTP cyclohydrolase I FolE [Staphylococcus pseudintermedius]|nr:GTP cyclohydrolase I FolE [Staphylococcus pseudintermedius]